MIKFLFGNLRMLVLLLMLVALVVLSIAGCQRDNQSRKTPAELVSDVVERTRPTDPTSEELATTSTKPSINLGKIEEGDLLFTAIVVDRHGLGLVTFMDAAGDELARDSRIQIQSQSIEGYLRPDGTPVAYIRFLIDASLTESPMEGRQYIVVAPDYRNFLVVTCVTSSETAHQCDDELFTLDLTIIQ